MADKTFLDSVGLQQALKELSTKIKNTFVKKTDFDNLASVAKTGNYNDLNGKPQIPEGTITEIIMNGKSQGTSGQINLGTVLTQHQSLDDYINSEKLKQNNNSLQESFLESLNQKTEIISINIDVNDRLMASLGEKSFYKNNVEITDQLDENYTLDDVLKHGKDRHIIINTPSAGSYMLTNFLALNDLENADNPTYNFYCLSFKRIKTNFLLLLQTDSNGLLDIFDQLTLTPSEMIILYDALNKNFYSKVKDIYYIDNDQWNKIIPSFNERLTEVENQIKKIIETT